MAWQQREPSGATVRGFAAQELDPLGADAGTFATSLTPTEHALISFGSSYNPANPDVTYTIDGIRMPVEDFIAHAGFILKDPLGLLDRFARQSAIPIGKRAEGVKFGHRAEIIYDANGNKVYEKWWYDPELSEVSYGQEYYIYSDASLELDLIPNGTPVEKADVEAYRARIVKMLENPICKKFIQELLEEARTQTGKSYADILTTFDTIKFFWGDTNPHGGLAHFVADPANPANGIPAATISDTIIKRNQAAAWRIRRIEKNI